MLIVTVVFLVQHQGRVRELVLMSNVQKMALVLPRVMGLGVLMAVADVTHELALALMVHK